jgi:short-subunit dehydrogenase
VLTARRKEMLDEFAAQINGKGQIAFVVAADVTTEADVARLSNQRSAGDAQFAQGRRPIECAIEFRLAA